MKPYGIKSLPWSLDVGDIHLFGLKSSAGTIPGPGGKARGYCRNSASKRATRRIYKRRARAEGKREILENNY